MAQGRKTGGKQKGSLNKATLAKQAAVAEVLPELTPEQVEQLQPKEVMLLVMQRALAVGNSTLALQAAKEAAPYKQSRLSAVEMPARIEDVTKLTDEELLRIAAGGVVYRDREHHWAGPEGATH